MVTQNRYPAGEASSIRMIDISSKVATKRLAVAEGHIYIPAKVIELIKNKQMPKGDTLALAEVSAIMAAKNTSQILPLCHPLLLESVKVNIEIKIESITVKVEVITESKTGVEMEALVATTAALLCIYDLTKIVEPEIRIGEVKLLLKQGGKSGTWYPSWNKEMRS